MSSGRYMFGNGDLKERFPAVEGGGVVASCIWG